MSTPSPSTDRNLIFGLLALQMDFVTPEQLLDAMNAWMLRKTTPLSAILRERQMLNDRRSELLEAMVEEHLAQHGADVQASLAALIAQPAVKTVVLAQLTHREDIDVQTSLGWLPPGRGDAGRAGTSAQGTGTFSSSRRFRVLREHAKGGLGEVFVALDSELRREVALKQIQEQYADHAGSRARFVFEAEVTGNLEHPGIVPIYGLGVYADGRPYYAMRFIRGESMHDAIARFHDADKDPRRDPGERSPALRELLGRFLAVCHAVGYAHLRGVIHRDIKPGNVMLGAHCETLVVDWGPGTAGRSQCCRADGCGASVTTADGHGFRRNKDRAGGGHACVHAAGAGGRTARSRRDGQRRVCAGSDVIRPLDREIAVPRQGRAGSGAPRPGGAGPATEAVGAGRAGSRLRHGDGADAGRSLSDGAGFGGGRAALAGR
jgi:hypothetical protein